MQDKTGKKKYKSNANFSCHLTEKHKEHLLELSNTIILLSKIMIQDPDLSEKIKNEIKDLTTRNKIFTLPDMVKLSIFLAHDHPVFKKYISFFNKTTEELLKPKKPKQSAP